MSIPRSTFETEVVSTGEVTADMPTANDAKENGTDQNVQAVKTGSDKKCPTVDRISHCKGAPFIFK